MRLISFVVFFVTFDADSKGKVELVFNIITQTHT